MNISMGAFGNTGPGLGARGWGTASDMARHRVLASLCMGKGKKKIKDIGGKTHSCGKEKERNREGADGETEKPEKRRVPGQPAAAGHINNDPRTG